jgi:hypothetical protein
MIWTEKRERWASRRLHPDSPWPREVPENWGSLPPTNVGRTRYWREGQKERQEFLRQEQGLDGTLHWQPEHASLSTYDGNKTRGLPRSAR